MPNYGEQLFQEARDVLLRGRMPPARMYTDPYAAVPAQTMSDLNAYGEQYGTGIYTVNPNRRGRNSAELTNRDLIQAQFADYTNRYLPVAMGLIRDVGIGYESNLQNELGMTSRAIAASFGAEEGAAKRRAERYGLRRDFDLGNEQVSAMVGGMNATRLAAQDRRASVMGAAGLGRAAAVSSGG